MNAETFVYEGQEVRKTGRVAIKTIKTINNLPREITLIEVTPISEDGWKKWVNETDLFRISTTQMLLEKKKD